jgi:hypothetical protein
VYPYFYLGNPMQDRSENLLLDDLIKRLQLFQNVYGNIPVAFEVDILEDDILNYRAQYETQYPEIVSVKKDKKKGAWGEEIVFETASEEDKSVGNSMFIVAFC